MISLLCWVIGLSIVATFGMAALFTASHEDDLAEQTMRNMGLDPDSPDGFSAPTSTESFRVPPFSAGVTASSPIRPPWRSSGASGSRGERHPFKN